MSTRHRWTRRKKMDLILGGESRFFSHAGPGSEESAQMVTGHHGNPMAFRPSSLITVASLRSKRKREGRQGPARGKHLLRVCSAVVKEATIVSLPGFESWLPSFTFGNFPFGKFSPALCPVFLPAAMCLITVCNSSA